MIICLLYYEIGKLTTFLHSSAQEYVRLKSKNSNFYPKYILDYIQRVPPKLEGKSNEMNSLLVIKGKKYF